MHTAPHVIRRASPADADACAEIYAPYVLGDICTFEEVPPDAGAMAGRVADVINAGLPWNVAVGPDGRIEGYAYAAPFKVRSGYRFTVEDSVYIRRESRGRGVGRALLAGVIDECARLGFHRMVAIIGGGPENVASIRLHERAGFQLAGVLPGVGWKFNRALDSAYMVRALASPK